jgi:hypothetical protein
VHERVRQRGKWKLGSENTNPLRDVLARCLAFKPDDRYASAAAMRADLPDDFLGL